jgi:asparagine synthase (glutamine-hydrolysing)
MCGIVGIYNYGSSRGKVEASLINRMNDTMVHRGPDAEGTWISDDGKVGLGHRRLSIIDLSDTASQPMGNEDGTIWVVYNGEIYNHFEIRPELEKAGHHFKSDHSDTEVILHAYEEWGIDCINRFRGMFAFGLWDGKRRCLWLVRDRIGIKPLYYTLNSGRLIFASEIKAILEDPSISRAVDEESFYNYLSFLTTPAPNTLFKGIKKLPGGCLAKIDVKGNFAVRRYWDVWDHTNPLIGVSEDEIAERLIDELRTTVNYRKVSDVPVGVFLSGGVDSSTNTALFSEGENSRVKTFSIGYDVDYSSYQNEFQYAQIMADRLHTEHYEKRLTIDNLIDFLPSLIHHQDEPIADPVCVPVYYVSKLARDNGVIVCQVGEGSDELFWGYPLWKRSLSLQKLSDVPLSSPLKSLGLAMFRIMGKEDKMYYEWLRRASQGEPVFWGGSEGFTEERKMRLLSNRMKNRLSSYSSFEVLKPILHRFREKAWEQSHLNWMSYLDLNIRLPELLLMRVDKMSMATSLEARVPFLDHKFVELAMSIPESIKTRRGNLKYILKKSVRGLIPDEIIDREKQGFGVPVYEWFFDKLGESTRKELSSFCDRTDYLDKTEVMNYIDKGDGRRAWFLLNFALWHKTWIESN